MSARSSQTRPRSRSGKRLRIRSRSWCTVSSRGGVQPVPTARAHDRECRGLPVRAGPPDAVQGLVGPGQPGPGGPTLRSGAPNPRESQDERRHRTTARGWSWRPPRGRSGGRRCRRGRRVVERRPPRPGARGRYGAVVGVLLVTTPLVADPSSDSSSRGAGARFPTSWSPSTSSPWAAAPVAAPRGLAAAPRGRPLHRGPGRVRLGARSHRRAVGGGPGRARTCIRSPCGPNRLSTSAGCGPGVAEPVRHPGVELGDLARPEHEVVLAEQQAEPAGQDVEPLVALVGLLARRPRRALSGGKICLNACSPPGRRVSGRNVIAVRTIGSARTRGSPVSGRRRARRAAPGGRGPAAAAAPGSGRRCPDSSRDSVLTEMPVASASWARVAPALEAQRAQPGADRRPAPDVDSSLIVHPQFAIPATIVCQ